VAQWRIRKQFIGIRQLEEATSAVASACPQRIVRSTSELLNLCRDALNMLNTYNILGRKEIDRMGKIIKRIRNGNHGKRHQHPKSVFIDENISNFVKEKRK